MTSGGSEERLCIAFQLQLAEVLQMPGKAALWGLFVALLEAGEMAFLGVLEVSEESSSVQAVNQARLQNKPKPCLCCTLQGLEVPASGALLMAH